MTLDPIHGKYLPVAIELTDPASGEVKRIEMDYRHLTVPKAYEWSRGLAYFLEAVYAWRYFYQDSAALLASIRRKSPLDEVLK